MPDLDVVGFAAYLKLKDSRDITIRRHVRGLKEMASTIVDFTFIEVKQYLEAKKLAGIANSTLNNYISTIRLYADFKALGQDLIKYPLFVRRQTVVRKTLSDSQVEDFLAVKRWSNYMPEHRHRMYTVFWSIIAFTALRPGECARLKREDIDLANKQIVLRPEITKTHQFSTIPLFPNIYPIVFDYMKDLKTDYLFPSRHGGKYDNGDESVIGQRDWGDDFNHRLKEAGIEKTPGLVPYSLRHSCATRWISNDMSFYKVRRLMRHAKIEQTLVYEHMTSAHLVSSVVKYDPLVRKHTDPIHVIQSLEEVVKSFCLEDDVRFSEDFIDGLRSAFHDEKRRLRSLTLGFDHATVELDP